MNPEDTGRKYDKIASWWHEQHRESNYGVGQIQHAMAYLDKEGKALDVGCGAGGRVVKLLEQHQLEVQGIDVSKQMIALARQNHPNHQFLHQDICTWQTDERFEAIIAWDSIFHLPLTMQRPVLNKMCSLLNRGGIIIYSFGDAQGEHTDTWKEDTFYYSSLGINENLSLLIENGLTILHVELDQYPEKHVYVIAIRR